MSLWSSAAPFMAYRKYEGGKGKEPDEDSQAPIPARFGVALLGEAVLVVVLGDAWLLGLGMRWESRGAQAAAYSCEGVRRMASGLSHSRSTSFLLAE